MLFSVSGEKKPNVPGLKEHDENFYEDCIVEATGFDEAVQKFLSECPLHTECICVRKATVRIIL